ncbi:MAG TPA: hypothetical protein VGL23_10860 [Chloroflexota bacterium]|jgi:hypothetical protein
MAASQALTGVGQRSWGWLRGPTWDLTFVSLSVVLVALPYAGYQLMTGLGLEDSTSASVIDLVVTLFIGGPHMYATFSRTVADPDFRARHRRVVATSALIPVGVVLLGFWAFPLLLTLFFLWASVHVLHQIAFLVECYNRRAPRPPSLVERAVDHAVVLTSLYPLAARRLVDGTFEVSGTALELPPLLRREELVWLAAAAFCTALALFLAKTLRELAQGRAHPPKLLLIGLTVAVAFWLPALDRLDAALQGFNAWHSFQYLGLTWYANLLAARRGRTEELAGLRVPTDGWRFYGALLLCTLTTGLIWVLLTLLRGPLGLAPEQPYYITVLSFLLIHYYHDHFLFTKPEAIVVEPGPGDAPIR